MTDEGDSLIQMPSQESLYFTHHSALRFNHALAPRRTNEAPGLIETVPPRILTELFECLTLPFAEAQFSQAIANHGPKSVWLAEDLRGFNGSF
jgi:hypothetical protein